MKKNYFLSICLMLFMTVQATAQSFTIDQLFGKWRFKADVEFTDAATQAHKETLSGDCEATISADENYIAKIVGFAGSSAQQNINAIGAKEGQDMAKVINLNNPQLWSDLLLANENGDNPYGVFADGEWKVQSYGPVYYNVYIEDGMITIPDFTVVKVTDYQAEKATVIAKYTNVKMILEEAEVVEVSDISGEYQFKAGAGAYDTMEGSVIPTDFAVTLAKTSDDNRTYDATIAIEGYDNVVLPASYNGVSVVLEYDNTYLDEANGIRFAPMYGDATAGEIEFMSQSETAFSLYSGFAFASDAIVKAADGVTDSLVVNGNYHQWYISGSLKMVTDAPAFDWAGVYTVKTTDENGLYIADAAGFDWPTEFQIEVEYNEDWGLYLVTKVFGMDVADLNYGGLDFIPAEDGKSVEIKTGYLYTVSPGVAYLALRDMNMSTEAIEMVVNEDGTMSVAGLSVVTTIGGEETLNVFYSNLAVTKEAAEPEAPAFSWAGQHTVKVGKVDSYDGNEYPSEFTMTVADYGDYMLVTEFLGNDIAAINYGGLEFTVAEDGKSAEMATGGFVGGSYPSYMVIYDMNAQESPILFTLNADGSVSVDNFFVKSIDYNTNESTPAAYFQDVTIPAAGGSVEPEAPEAFDWVGTWEVTSGSQVSYDGKAYPEKFYMTIEHNEAWGMTLITQFMSTDVAGVNDGGILLTIAEDNKSAEMEVGVFAGVFAGGSYSYYLKIYDMNGTADYPVVLTANEDGTITFEDFFLATYNWDTTALSPAVFYQQVTATKCSTGIEEVKGESGKVKGIFDMQGRKIDAITAPGLYIVDGKKVLVK